MVLQPRICSSLLSAVPMLLVHGRRVPDLRSFRCSDSRHDRGLCGHVCLLLDPGRLLGLSGLGVLTLVVASLFHYRVEPLYPR